MKILVRDLFGIQMAEQELTAQERWDGPDGQPIRKFQLSHEEEGSLGVLYFDLHPREGKYAHADLSIYTNNDRLSNLLLKKTTFNEVLEEGSLKYRGDKDLLFQAVDAFTLDDYQEYNPLDFIL